MESNFPANSNTTPKRVPKKAAEPKKVDKVTTGEVITRKKSLGTRFREAFAGNDNRGVMEYVMLDVLVPAAKDMIADAVSMGVERKLFGEVRSSSRRGRPSSHGSYTSYRRMSDDPRNDRRDPRSPRRGRNSIRLDDIVLETRAEAITVIERLYDLIGSYEVATVGDLYDLIGETGDFTDDRYGWTDMRGADVRRVRDGYLLEIPRPQPID